MLRLLGFVACLALAGAGHAQEIRGGYIGAGYGVFSYDEEDPPTGIRISDSTGSYRLFGGYQLNSNYAIEVGWSQATDLSEDFPGLLDIDVEWEVATLRVIALAPFSNISMFGGLGYYDATATTTRVLTPPGQPEQRLVTEAGNSGFTVAGGLQFDLSRIAVRGEYEWFDTDGNTDASSINVNVLFRF